jgi:ligand-binding sensor domain-containing protein/two-component sensor histidine kinase
MTLSKSHHRVSAAGKFSLSLVVLFVISLNLGAQRLPFHNYGVHDGLAHAHVNSVYQDRKGYLWFGTWEGLSRFDGYGFTNYGMRDGLANPIINDITEDRQGNLWVATQIGGVARLIDDPREAHLSSPDGAQSSSARKKFINYSVSDVRESNVVGALLFDAENNLWCVTEAGIYRARTPVGVQRSDLKFELMLSRPPTQGSFASALTDDEGRLWFGFYDALIEVSQGRIVEYHLPDNPQHDPIVSIQLNTHGGLFVASYATVFEFFPPTVAANHEQWRKLPLTLAPRPEQINVMLSDASGALWLGTSYGLIKYQDHRQTTITAAQGLSENHIISLFKDREGNLWIGTGIGGVCRLSSEKFVSFAGAEGLRNQDTATLVEDHAGHIYASTQDSGIFELTEGKAVAVAGSQETPFNTVGRRILQDARGDWWVGTEQGLFRFRGPRLQFQQGEKFKSADGIPEVSVFNGPGMYEDSAGKIWIGLLDHNLYWFDPARRQSPLFQHISLQDDWQSYTRNMLRDRTGALWVGGFGGMLRLVDDKPIRVEPTEGLPEANPRAFFLDSRGWLWIGLRFGGVSVVKDANSMPLKFINYSTANGLSSDAVWSITEDEDGRMYFGTGKGLDQLDVMSGAMRHFTTDNGLAGDGVNYCFKDTQGNIWAGTTGGVSKFNPHVESRDSQPPPVYLSRVRVAGEDLPMSETGAAFVPALNLTAAQNNLLVEYVGLGFGEDQKLKYQYKLEGAGSDWSAPTEQRTINYAHLAPGSYRFLVRAVTAEGVASPAPAVFEFLILPPVWQRWWFVSAATLIFGLMIYAVHRYRVARLIELERVRTRIATELHDDIGSNLSRIALLSEVVRRQVSQGDPQVNERLSLIAGVSRESVDSMSDIVWAINPEKDHLGDLTQRIRRVAGDILAACDVELRFHARDVDPDIKLDVDTRREIFLVFKESLNNIVRHANCTEADIEFRLERGRLVLRMSDNGRGFDCTQAAEGNGLASMKQRARNLGGELRATSAPGAGTTIVLSVPLDHHHWLRSRSHRNDHS